MKSVLLVASVQSHIAQFHRPLIRWLDAQGCRVDVAAGNNLAAKPDLHLEVSGDIYDIPFSRVPLSPKNIRAYRILRKIVNTGSYDIIHCNTPVAGILARMAANRKRKSGETAVIYEAHGFHFFRGGPKRNWVLWYPVEKWFSQYADVLITINKMDYLLACRHFHTKKILQIPGVGVDLSQFQEPEKNLNLRSAFDLPEDSKIVISVGELNRNKNHQVIIRALACLNDPKVHYFLAGNGPLETRLKQLTKRLAVEKNVHFLGYRRDIPALLKNADVYVLPSLREGLGISAIEAMALGLPLVTSDRHGINDYSENGVTGFQYGPMDAKGFAEGIRRILQDAGLKQRMGSHNMEIAGQFAIEKSLEKLCAVYREILDDPG